MITDNVRRFILAFILLAFGVALGIGLGHLMIASPTFFYIFMFVVVLLSAIQLSRK